jgi:DEAD/DEAH box helicase domain-containing protein
MGDQLLGEIESRYVPREAHEGAIYLHDGDPYRVASVDDDQRLIHVRVSDDGVLTDPIGERLIIERGQLAQRSVGPIEVALLEVTIVDRVTGYQEIDQVTMRQRGSPFDLPRPRDMRLETIAVRIKHAAAYGSHLHALEHTIRALGSLVVVCDPADLQGHTELEGMPKAYIYDRTAGGVGLARRLFERLPEVLAAARDRIASCACDSGCPACIQSGSCPRRNEALDKAGALSLVTGVV